MNNFDRHRRLRTTAAMRDLMRETVVTKNDLIAPVFVEEGLNGSTPISSMPGVSHFGLDSILDEIQEIVDAGIKSIILFGLPKDENKDDIGTGAWSDNGIVQQATRKIKDKFPKLIIVADCCMCEYTSTGHCGIVKDGYVDNDESLKYIARTAVSQAKAGADIIAPSNAMDGYVTAIRSALDSEELVNIPIMSYAVKYASSFYGPFREAANSAPQFGDRKSYQMDPANRLESIREAVSDQKEGADFVMVKPSMAFLDVMREIKDQVNLPMVAYNVSGEYAMIKAAAANGWIDEQSVVYETLTGMKRAGADLIITYFAKDYAKYLDQQGE